MAKRRGRGDTVAKKAGKLSNKESKKKDLDHGKLIVTTGMKSFEDEQSEEESQRGEIAAGLSPSLVESKASCSESKQDSVTQKKGKEIVVDDNQTNEAPNQDQSPKRRPEGSKAQQNLRMVQPQQDRDKVSTTPPRMIKEPSKALRSAVTLPQQGEKQSEPGEPLNPDPHII
ncbi:OLC1v1009523C1 [Oldenlandia corymbosa var. corymbosa]|uniref:OLC1v1009523C1 n=1 Tax=Oldenlandia corymbosa var. corymbosa TaxID=529605 RepID=A0AAV1DP58_OLDCO|nr:OLC1v1009523C1 [Oldenlandia corymbosa var. corymbosa]